MSVMTLSCSWYMMLTWGLWTALSFAKWPGSVQDSRIMRESQLFAALESPRKPLTGVFLGDSGYMLTLILNSRDHKRAYTDAHCVDVAVKVAVTCCINSSCINQLAPDSGCGGGSGSGAGITDDDTSGMPTHVPLVTYFNWHLHFVIDIFKHVFCNIRVESLYLYAMPCFSLTRHAIYSRNTHDVDLIKNVWILPHINTCVCVCVCVCACLRACVRACARACVRVCG